MKRKPRASDEQILPRPLLIWVGIAGLVLGGATLGVIGWADDHYGSSAIARTMGMTTFAISNVVFSLTTRDERRSIFSLDVLEDRMFLLCTGGSLAAILLGTELGLFQRILRHRPPRPAPVARLHRRRARDRARCPRRRRLLLQRRGPAPAHGRRSRRKACRP